MTFPGGLQGKFIAAFLVVEVVGILLAGAVFVALNRDDERQAALDRVAATSPLITAGFVQGALLSAQPFDVEAFVAASSEAYDVRVIVVDETGTVIEDSDADIVGQPIALPEPASIGGVTVSPIRAGRFLQNVERTEAYVRWSPPRGDPGNGFVFFSSEPVFRRVEVETSGEAAALPEFSVVVGVPETSISRAWLDLLPGLGLAGGIALPIAFLLAVVLGRTITAPLNKLTLASQRMAAGSFEVDVPTRGGDELGELGRAFSTMATRVGQTQTEMRMLVANVSHDLKTPLTSIRGFAQALRSGAAESDADVERMGRIIEEEAARLGQRLGDLLFLSELEAGQAVLEKEPIDLGRLAASIVARLAPGNARVRLDLAEGVVADADPGKLERAIENLITNALRYAPPEAAIDVRVLARNGHAVLEVANPAPGLAADEIPRLFERFYRRDRTRRAVEQGSGLGLPIARDLVQLHGGTLTAERRGEEVVFTVSLPAPG